MVATGHAPRSRAFVSWRRFSHAHAEWEGKLWKHIAQDRWRRQGMMKLRDSSTASVATSLRTRRTTSATCTTALGTSTRCTRATTAQPGFESDLPKKPLHKSSATHRMTQQQITAARQTLLLAKLDSTKQRLGNKQCRTPRQEQHQPSAKSPISGLPLRTTQF